MLLVFMGGALGATLRTVLMWIPLPLSESAQLTCINLLGAFALGLLLGAVTAPKFDGTRAFVGTGMLGGFTSYSALVVGMRPDMDGFLGVLFAVVTVIVATLAALLALRLGRLMTGPNEAEGGQA